MIHLLLKYLIKKLTLEKLNGFGQFMTQTDPSNTPAPKMVKRLVTKSDNDCFSMKEMQSNLAWSGWVSGKTSLFCFSFIIFWVFSIKEIYNKIYIKSFPKQQNKNNSGYFYDDGSYKTAIAAFIQKFHHFSFGFSHILHIVIHSSVKILKK